MSLLGFKPTEKALTDTAVTLTGSIYRPSEKDFVNAEKRSICTKVYAALFAKKYMI